MRWAIRLAVSALAIYVVASASTDQQIAMMNGMRAFAGAAHDACTRSAYCNDALQGAGRLTHATTERLGRISAYERGQPLLER